MQDFINWFGEEVKGIKRFRDIRKGNIEVGMYRNNENPLTELGKFGWFTAYSWVTGHYDYDPEGWQYEKVDPDTFAQTFNGSFLVDASRRLQAFGFTPFPLTVVFVDFLLPKGTEGQYEPQNHMIRLLKTLAPDRMLHNLIHEWAHAYWRQIMTKENKQSFTAYYFGTILKSGSMNLNLDPYATEGGPGEMFCEMIAEAICDPGRLTKEEMKLIRMVASRAMPRMTIADLNQGRKASQAPGGTLPPTGLGAEPV